MRSRSRRRAGQIAPRGRRVDEIGFNIHPVLLGAGIPLFHPMPHQIDLELKECKPFKNGCVALTYGVKH